MAPLRDITDDLKGKEKTQDLSGLLSYAVEVREVQTHDIYQMIFNGVEVIKEPTKWLGRYFPFFAVVGDELPLDDGVYRAGIVRAAKDPQRMYNYWRSASAESIALSPKQPYVGSMAMIKGFESEWLNANNNSQSFLPVTADTNFSWYVAAEATPR